MPRRRVLPERTSRVTGFELERILSQGFFADNLRAVANGCTASIELAKHPAALLVLEHVCDSVAERWEGGAVQTVEVSAGRAALEPHMVTLLRALDGDDDATVAEQANQLARAFSRWRAG
jgi:hypothetical protein